MPFSFSFCDLDFSGEIHTVLLHIVHFVVIATLHICMRPCVCVCTCTYVSMPGSLGFTAFPVIFLEVMTSAEQWVAFQKRLQLIIAWYFYWSKRVLKIQMIVFLWWSHSVLVFFVFCRNDSSGGHRVLALSLDEIQTGWPSLRFCSGTGCF